MLAAYASGVSASDPMSCLTIGDIDEPPVPADWVSVTVRAASLNHHDVWSLKGQALAADRVPMILGTDAAGVTDDGREVIVHAVVGEVEAGEGDETLDPRRSLLSELYPGALAERVRVPARNLIDKPAELSFEEADGVAHRISHDRLEVRDAARGHDACSGRRRGSVDRTDRDRPRAGAPGVGHLPR